MQNSRQGFTLIEIMVVLVIIGIMAALIVPNVIGRPAEAKITITKVDLKTIAGALDIYNLDNNNYPSTQQGLEALISKPTGTPEAKNWKEGGYLKKLPVDPWGAQYQYLSPGSHGKYDLYSYGPDGKDGKSMIGEWEQ